MTGTDLSRPVPAMAASTTDFDFLQGGFDVTSRRLRDPLDAESGWVQSAATARARTLFAGAISVDEMWFPDESMYGLSLRVFDPNEHQWAVYWVSSKSGVLQPPVSGVWEDGTCWFTGPDDYLGLVIDASYSWSRITDRTAHWEQCFSIDGGATWQPNWTMDWARRDAEPDHRNGPRAIADFDFLAGRWTVQHRRLSDPLDPSSPWTEFESSSESWTYFNGAVSIDETGLAEPGHRGLAFRTYNPATEQWSIYWINSRTGQVELPPVVGRFTDGVGTFYARECIAGRNICVRFIWDAITSTTARWRQAFSDDGGAVWWDNWEMRLHRGEPAA